MKSNSIESAILIRIQYSSHFSQSSQCTLLLIKEENYILKSLINTLIPTDSDYKCICKVSKYIYKFHVLKNKKFI